MKKIILSALTLLMGASAFNGCTSWIEEDPDSFITPDMVGDSEDAASQWVTGVYSKWVNDMFRWVTSREFLSKTPTIYQVPTGCSAASEPATSKELTTPWHYRMRSGTVATTS